MICMSGEKGGKNIYKGALFSCHSQDYEKNFSI